MILKNSGKEQVNSLLKLVTSSPRLTLYTLSREGEKKKKKRKEFLSNPLAFWVLFCSASPPHWKILNTNPLPLFTCIMHSFFLFLTLSTKLTSSRSTFPRAMYTHRNASLSRADADSLSHFLSPPDASTASPMQYSAAAHHQLGLGEFDNSVHELNYSEMSSSNTYNSCSSGCTSYMGSPSSLASNYESWRVVQSSVSSRSLQKNGGAQHQPFSEFSLLFSLSSLTWKTVREHIGSVSQVK